MTAFGLSKGDETVRTCRVLLIDLKLFNYHHFYTDELTPIEIRIRKLVEDFFANKIAAHEFKFELRRIHLSRHLRRSYSPCSQKYGVYPIYSTRLFLDARNRDLPFLRRAVLHAQIEPQTTGLRFLMTDLYLEDFRDLSGKKLGHVLLYEQQKMFGEQKSSWSKTGDDRLFLTSLAVLIINLIRPREKNARN